MEWSRCSYRYAVLEVWELSLDVEEQYHLNEEGNRIGVEGSCEAVACVY